MVVVPVLFLLLLGACGGLLALYMRHRRLQNNFTTFANSHYNSRLGSAIFSSGDDLGKGLFMRIYIYIDIYYSHKRLARCGQLHGRFK